ncbi:aconitate hydratase [compost metagenome]
MRLPRGTGPHTIDIKPGDKIHVEAPAHAIAPRCRVPVHIERASGAVDVIDATAAVETQLEAELLRRGGVIPLILHQTLSQPAS